MMLLKAARAVGFISFATAAAASSVGGRVTTPDMTPGVTFDLTMNSSTQPVGPAGAGFSMTARGMADA
ncbi:MAG: hypothetical protein M3Y64_06515, partial [Gemmatimonadota bacterium]|nr:hypothetical protein [Gemmatimonadota bacterium]